MAEELLEARGVRYGEVREEFERRLELVGLARDVLGRYPIELSGGMKQRVVLVLSTLLDPSLLVADEVTSALDVSTQKSVAGCRQLPRQGVRQERHRHHPRPVVLYQIADTILVMYAGKLAEKAPTAAIIEDPRHPYTRATHLLPAGGRRALPGPATEGSPAIRHRCSTRLPGAASATAARWPRPSASRSHHSGSWSLVTGWPAGRQRMTMLQLRTEARRSGGRLRGRHAPGGA